MYHLLGFENGINKRHILGTRLNSFCLKGQATVSQLFPCVFLLFFRSSLQTHPPSLALEGKGAWLLVGSGKSPTLLPGDTLEGNVAHADHDLSTVSCWMYIQYLARSHSLPPIFLLSPALFLSRSHWNQWTFLWSEELLFGVCKTALVGTTEMNS